MPEQITPYTSSPTIPADKKAKLDGLVKKLKSEGYHPDDINLLVKTAEKKYGEPLLGKGQDAPISKPIDNTPKPEVSQVKDLANYQKPKIESVKTTMPEPDNEFMVEPERETPKLGNQARKETAEAIKYQTISNAKKEGEQKAEQYFTGNNLKEKKLDRFDYYSETFADNFLGKDKELYQAAKEVQYKEKFSEFGKDDSKAEDKYASLMKKRTLDIDNEIRNLQSIVERGYIEETIPTITGTPVVTRKAISEEDKVLYQDRIKELNGQKGWFFQPQQKVQEVAEAYSKEIAELPNIDDDTTPLEALKMLYLDKYDAFNKLKDELGYDNKLIHGLRELKGLVTSNPKEELFKELASDLKALAPIALLNLPPQEKKEGFLKTTAQSFIKNTFRNGLIPPNTPETNQAIVKAIEEAKIKKEEVNPEIWKNIENNQFYKSWTPQAAGDMLGNSLSYFMPVSVTSKLIGVTKIGKALSTLAQSGRLASTGKIATQINKLPVGINKLAFGVTEQGLLFGLAGTIFSRGDELNPATGAAGSVGEQSANKILESFSKVFGKKAPAAIKYVSALFGKGFAETSQEFGEETVQTIQQMDNGKFLPTVVKMFQDGEVYQEFKKNMSQKFPDLSETGWFAVNTLVMGMVFGLGSVKYEDFKKQVVDSVPENERESVIKIIEESEKEREQIGNQAIKEQAKENPQDKVLQEFSEVNDELLAINEEIKNTEDPARLKELEAEKGQLESKQTEIINRMNEESSNVEEVEEVEEELPEDNIGIYEYNGVKYEITEDSISELESGELKPMDFLDELLANGVKIEETKLPDKKSKVKQAMVRSINELKAEVELMKQGKKSPEKDAKIAEFEREIALQEKMGIDPNKGRLEDVEEVETNTQTPKTLDSEENSGSQLIKRPETKPIDDAEILDIVKNKKVSPERLNEIAEKVDTDAELSPREKRVADMFAEDIKKINSPKKVKAIKEVGEVSDEEIIKFIDNNEVSDQRKQNIAYKKANDLELSPMEDDIYAQNKKEIDKFTKENNWLKDEKGINTGAEEQISPIPETSNSSKQEEKKRVRRTGTPKSQRQIRNPEKLKALEKEPIDAEDYVLQRFISGATIKRSVIDKLFYGGKRIKAGKQSKKEINTRISLYSKDGFESIDAVAHSLWENQSSIFGYEKFSDTEIRDAVEQVLFNHTSASSMATYLNGKYIDTVDNFNEDGSRINESGEKEFYADGVWVTEAELQKLYEEQQAVEEYTLLEKDNLLSDEEKAEILQHIDTLTDEEVEQLLQQNAEAFESIEAEIDYQAEEEARIDKPIGVENQIEDVLEGEGDEQKKEVQKKIKFAKENTDKIVSINGKKVYDVSIDEENNLRYNLRKKGELTNQNYYYPVQYAQIEYSTEETKQPSLQDELSQLQQEISDAKSNLEKAEKSLDKDLKANQGDVFAGGGQQIQLINDSADKKKEVDNRKKKLDSLLEKEKELKSRIEDNLPGQRKLEIQDKPKTQEEKVKEAVAEAPLQKDKKTFEESSDDKEPSFQTTDTKFTPLSKKIFDKFAKRLRAVFPKVKLNTFTDWKEALGISKEEVESVAFQTEYRGWHQAPTKEGNNSLDNMSDIFPNDLYSEKGFYYYADNKTGKSDKESYAKIVAFRGKPNAKVKIYRAVPKGVTKINSGDWVTLSKNYAKEHGENHINGEYEIIETEVEASKLFNEGSINEFGVQFLRTPNGTVYGFVKDGEVYINVNELNANTLVHEYAHIFTQMLKNQFPKAYNNLIDRIKQEKDLIANKKKDPNYAHLNEEQLADEVLADLVGTKGEQLLNAKKPLHQEIIELIKQYWNKVKNLFTTGSPNIAKWSVEDFKNATIEDIVNNETKDLLSGRKISNVSSDHLSRGTQYSQEQYKDGAKRLIKDLFEKVKNNENFKNISIGRLTDDAKKYLSKISGLDFKEFTDFIINYSELKHIYNDHFGENEKDTSSNIPLTEKDIENIVEVISNPDKIIFLGYDKKTQSNKFAFLKKSDKGTYNLLEVYGNSGGKLTVKTFFNTKKDPEKRTNEIVKLLSTSDNDFGVLDQRAINTNSFDTANIPTLIDFSKSEDVKFQIIGEKGAAALDRLEEATTRLDNLRVAKEMEGKTNPLDTLLNEYLKKGSSLDNENLMENYGLKRFTLQKKYGFAVLSLVETKFKGQGIGTKFMTDLINWADKNGISIALTPSTSFGATSVNRLKDFYKQFGFNENKGRSKDFSTTEAMIRTPKEVKQFTPQQIRLATGWERGADGKWRYEIDDKGISLRKIERIGNTGSRFIAKLSDVYDNKELYQAYPELKNVRVVFDNSKPIGNGVWRKEINEIIVYGDVENISPKDIEANFTLNSILLHEIQHAIQGIEGFAKGGNVEEMGTFSILKKNNFKSKEEIFDKINQLSDIINNTKIDKLPVGYSIEFSSTFGEYGLKSPNGAFVKQQTWGKTKKEALLNSLEYFTQNAKYKYIAEIQNLKTYNSNEAYELYRKLAGEVEARNVENRMAMSMEERRKTLLEETEDVARKDQLILIEGFGIAQSNPKEKTDKKFTSIPKKAYNNLVARLKKAFPNVQIFGDSEQLKQKLKEYGISATDFLFGYENNPNLSEQNAKELLKAQALQAQGVSNKEIREKTGWFVGLDGKWKYLIDDTNANFIVSEDWMRRKATGETPDFNYSFPFEEIFNHEEFVKNYPELVKSIRFTFYDKSSKTSGGQIKTNSKGEVVIAINIGFNPTQEYQTLRSIGLHEIQHRIQGVSKEVKGNRENASLLGGTSQSILLAKVKSAQKGGKGIVIYTKNGQKLDISSLNDSQIQNLIWQLYNNHFEEIEARAVMQNNDMAKVISELEEGFYYVSDVDDNINTIVRVKSTKNLDFLKTKDGEIYGALFPDGSMYLDPTKINANTPIHEFGHVWVNHIEKANPELFNKGISLISDSKYVEEVKSNPAYSEKSKPEILKEALVTAIGDKGEMLNKTQLARFMEWLQRLFTDVKRMFGDTGIRTIKAKEVQNLGLEQFLTGAVRDITGGKEIAISNLKKSEKKLENNINLASYENANPKREISQKAKGDSRNEKIANELQGRIRKAYKDAGYSEEDGGKVDLRDIDNKVAYNYAKETDTWIGDFDLLGKPFLSGQEHRTVIDETNNKILKSNNLSNVISLDKFFDKIRTHNELFPDTKYTFEGFSGIDMGGGRFYVEPVYSQDFIQNAENANPKEISDYMESEGFDKIEAFRYKKGSIEVWDVRPRNVLKDSDGNIYVIDAEFKNIKQESQPEMQLQQAKDQLKETLKEWWQSSKNMGIISDPEENARQDLKLFKALLNYAKVYIQANANATLEEFKKQIPVMFQRLNQDIIQDAFLQKEKTLADFGGTPPEGELIPALTKWETFRTFIQDYKYPILKMQEVIKELKGYDIIPDNENLYDQKELETGKIVNAINEAKKWLYGVKESEVNAKSVNKNSLNNRIKEATGLTLTDFGNWMYAMHAKERNARGREIDSTLEKPSGLTDDQADQILAEFTEHQAELEGFYQEFKENVLDKMLDVLGEANRYSPTHIEKMKKGLKDGSDVQFEWYVPLAVDESNFDFTVKREKPKKFIHSIVGTDSYDMIQRKNPVHHAFFKLAEAIKEAERLKTINTLAKIVVENPDDKTWEIVTPRQTPNGLIFNKSVDKDNVLLFYDSNYKLKGVHIKNADLAPVFKSMTTKIPWMQDSIQHYVNKFLKVFDTFMNLKRSFFTQFNLDFTVPNFIRDLTDTLSNISYVKKDVDANTDSLRRDVAKNIPGLYKDLFLYYTGKEIKGANKDWIEEYHRNGTKMSWLDYASAEEFTIELEKLVNNKQNDIAKYGGRLINYIGLINDVTENVLRVSTYKALRDRGISEQKSASIAKNISVNFEKKGRGGALINRFWLFANAGIQGAKNSIKVITTKEGQRVALGMVALGMLSRSLMDMYGDDDDDLYEGFDQDNNLLFPSIIPGKGPIKIPKTYSLMKVFINMGEDIYDFANGNKTVADATLRTLDGLLSTLDPIAGGGTNITSYMPTITQTPISIAANKDFKDSYIVSPFQISNKRLLKHEYSNRKIQETRTGQVLQKATKGLYDVGIADMNPVVLHFMIEQMIGGAPKSLLDTGINIYETATTDKKFNIGKIMVLRRFKVDMDYQEYRYQSALYKYLEKNTVLPKGGKLNPLMEDEIKDIKKNYKGYVDFKKKEMTGKTTKEKSTINAGITRMKNDFKEKYGIDISK